MLFCLKVLIVLMVLVMFSYLTYDTVNHPEQFDKE